MSSNGTVAVKATLMRGGTSKGLFFNLADLPDFAQQPGPLRDQLLLRIIGSPDPYEKQIDGLGGGSSSTSKVVIIAPSNRTNHDVDYLFGQVAIDQAKVDWSGNCGNLSAAVGSFAINQGLVVIDPNLAAGHKAVRIWQKNIQKTIIASVPIAQSHVVEDGDFYLDGVTFPSAEVAVEFVDPVDADDELFPTGCLTETLEVPNLGIFEVTMINAGIPTVFIKSDAIGLKGTELQGDINNNEETLAKLEQIRAYAAVKMGIVDHVEQAVNSPHIPKIAMVAPPKSYQSSAGKLVAAETIDLSVRAVSMGRLHHAMMGTAAVAIGVAAMIPGTLVEALADLKTGGRVCFGHPSGRLIVGAAVHSSNGQLRVESVRMSRSARRLMQGEVFIPSTAARSIGTNESM